MHDLLVIKSDVDDDFDHSLFSENLNGLGQITKLGEEAWLILQTDKSSDGVFAFLSQFLSKHDCLRVSELTKTFVK